VQPNYRVPWGDFPDVVIHIKVPTLRAYPGFVYSASRQYPCEEGRGGPR
jgi:hypothetical protein